MADARVLFYDVETAPILGYAWDSWDTNLIAIERDWSLLAVGWSWLGEDECHVVGLDDFPGYRAGRLDDRRITQHIHALFDEADVLVAYNGDRFDARKCQAKFLEHDLGPASPAQSVDPLKIARRHFKLTRNRLDDVARLLGVARKIETGGFQLWLDCMAGEDVAWEAMKDYCKQDVVVLKQVYARLMPWHARHPNLATVAERPAACPKCGVEGRMVARGTRHNAVTTRQQFQCTACRSYVAARALQRVDTEYVV